MKREYRTISGAQMRSTSENGKPGIVGYAAVFGQLSDDLGGFREIIRAGAFKRCLSAGADVRCLINHDASLLLGRTKSGTLRVAEDEAGLHYDCDTPNTDYAANLHESMARGDLDQCSFGFMVNQDNWLEATGTDGKPYLLRELLDVDVFDVSPVTYPAYPQTTVSARSLWPDGMPEGLEAHIREAQRPADPAPAAEPQAVSHPGEDALRERLKLRVWRALAQKV
jgi:HK97 family phage prohead protease